MYYRHFNLSGAPFQFTPSSAVLYPSKSHSEALAALEWGILHEPSGLTLLVGEPGTGKTTLISAVLERHFEHVRTAYIGNPKLNFDEILSVIGRQLGIEFTAPGRLARLDALDRYLEAHARSERVTVIIDEAQVLPDEVIEELRLLSNCAPGRSAALRFIFVGQPEFLHRLTSVSLRQLNERIGARAILNPLAPAEIREYIDFRLKARGGTASQIFAGRALKQIADHSDGIPRKVNVLCHNAMLLAYSRNRRRVRLAEASTAVAEYENLFSANSKEQAKATAQPSRLVRLWSRTRTAGPAAVAAAIIAGAIHLYPFRIGQPANRASAAPVVAASGPAAGAANPVTAPTTKTETVVVYHLRPSLLDGHLSLPGGDGDAQAAQTADPQPLKHKLREIHVQLGDTIAILAQRYLGSQYKANEIIAANPQLADANRIFPGDVVYLPVTDISEPRE
jgi:type II secretory pathway predicted ATPase ExeA/phage tail protein X